MNSIIFYHFVILLLLIFVFVFVIELEDLWLVRLIRLFHYLVFNNLSFLHGHLLDSWLLLHAAFLWFNETLLWLRLVVIREHHLHVSHLEWITIHSWLHILLLLCSPNYFFFNCTSSDEPVNGNRFSLAYSMRSVSRLSIHRWVPVNVIENDSVSSNQVDSQPTSSSGE